MTSISIRDSRQRQTLWLGREGSLLDEVEPELVESLFGVSYRRSFSCLTEFSVFCYDVTREIYDHVLETMPAVFIPHATPTRVVTPRGNYDVMWASSDQEERPILNCDDGPAPARDRGFAVVRLDPTLI